MNGVFISYRRDDCAAHAGRLYDRLVDRLGESAVFMDIDAIEPGADFGVRIQEAIGSCTLVVVLIGDHWLQIADARGRRRLEDPTDLVRHEVAAALRRSDVRVIPVLVEGAAMPAADQLPDDLKALARRNALDLSDARWRYDVERLIEVVERVVPPATPSADLAGAGRDRRSPSTSPHAEESADADADASSSSDAHRATIVAPPKAAPAAGHVSKRALATALAVAAIAVTVVVALKQTPDDGRPAARPDINANAPGATTAGTTTTQPPQQPASVPDHPIPIAARPNSITIAGGNVWVLSTQSGEIVVLDARTSKQIDRIPIGEGGTSLAGGFKSVWRVEGNTGALTRRSASTRRAVPGSNATISVPGQPVTIATGEGAVWVGVRKRGRRDGSGESLVRVNPSTPEQSAIAVPGGVQDVAAGAGAVWVSTMLGDSVLRIDARARSKTKEIGVGKQPKGIAVGYGAVWVAASGSDWLTRISPRGFVTDRIALGVSPTRVAVGGGSVWVTAQEANRLLRVDPEKRSVSEQIDTGGRPFALDVGKDSVWLTLLNEGVQRISYTR